MTTKNKPTLFPEQEQLLTDFRVATQGEGKLKVCSGNVGSGLFTETKLFSFRGKRIPFVIKTYSRGPYSTDNFNNVFLSSVLGYEIFRQVVGKEYVVPSVPVKWKGEDARWKFGVLQPFVTPYAQISKKEPNLRMAAKAFSNLSTLRILSCKSLILQNKRVRSEYFKDIQTDSHPNNITVFKKGEQTVCQFLDTQFLPLAFYWGDTSSWINKLLIRLFGKKDITRRDLQKLSVKLTELSSVKL